MKKRLIPAIVFCLLLFTEKSMAQSETDTLMKTDTLTEKAPEQKAKSNSRRHEFGALVGIQGAQFTADPSFDQKLKISAGGKLYWSYMFGGIFAIRAEVGVDNWGTKFNSDTSLRLFYLTLPAIAAQVKLGPLKVYAGPQLNLLLSAKQKDGSSVDYKEFFKSTDISGMVGAEVNLPFFIMIGARYNFGLSNISDIDAQTIKNGAFMAYVGVHFRR